MLLLLSEQSFILSIMRPRTHDHVVFDVAEFDRVRLAKMLTPTDVAKRAGVSTTLICQARKGRPVSLRYAKIIAAALRVPLQKIIKGFRDQCEANPIPQSA